MSQFRLLGRFFGDNFIFRFFFLGTFLSSWLGLSKHRLDRFEQATLYKFKTCQTSINFRQNLGQFSHQLLRLPNVKSSSFTLNIFSKLRDHSIQLGLLRMLLGHISPISLIIYILIFDHLSKLGDAIANFDRFIVLF